MATASVISPITFDAKGVASITWTFTTGVSGSSNAANFGAYMCDKTVYWSATTAGTANLCVIEGSDAATGPWITLTDEQGNDLATTTNTIMRTIQQNTPFVRARADTVTSGTVLRVTITAKGIIN